MTLAFPLFGFLAPTVLNLSLPGPSEPECLLFLGLIRALAQNFDQKPKHACSVEFGVLVDIASKLKLRLRYCCFKGKHNCTNITMLSKVTVLNNFMYLRNSNLQPFLLGECRDKLTNYITSYYYTI